MTHSKKMDQQEILNFFLEFKRTIPLKINPHIFTKWLFDKHQIKIDRKTVVSKLQSEFSNEKKSFEPKDSNESNTNVEVRNVLSLIEENINKPEELRKIGNQLQHSNELHYKVAKEKLSLEQDNKILRKQLDELRDTVMKDKKLISKLNDSVEEYRLAYQQLIALSTNPIYFDAKENIVRILKASATDFYPPQLKVIETASDRRVVQSDDKKITSIEKLISRTNRNGSKEVLSPSQKSTFKNNLLIGGAFDQKNLLINAKTCLNNELEAAMIYLNIDFIRGFSSKYLRQIELLDGFQFISENFSENFEIILHGIIHPFNLANLGNKGIIDASIKVLRKQIEIAEGYYSAKQLVIHPGSYINLGEQEKGIKRLIKSLNEVIMPSQSITISIEMMAGRGTELGRSFDEIAKILDGVVNNDKLSVCLDTCHLWDAGYDIKNDLNQTLTSFDKIIGMDKVKVLHINDSKNNIGSRVDRHANIGAGFIGHKALHEFCKLANFSKIPKILETPMIGTDIGFRKEKDILVSGDLPEFWLESIDKGILV
ncbi:deoxyribonuclease IV [Paenibacillus sp. MBLB4367]|uniref:deoxyribonuclease IV n=1 Tax=Paenibacillus sp. MBLB4367 TaxID=3384767 RepID=UPI0039084161